MNTKNIRSKLAIVVTSLLFSALPLAAMAAVPYISSTSPSSTSAGGVALTLTVYGNNFDSNSVVYFNGSARPTGYVSSSQLVAVMNASDTASLGTYNINVVNTEYNGGTSNNVTLSVYGVVMNNPVPTLMSISPSSAMVNSGNFILTLYGSNFVPSSSARFNGFLRATTYVSANQLTAIIPASDITTAVSDAVSVVNPIPGGGESNMLLFTVNPVSTTPGLPNTGFGPVSTSQSYAWVTTQNLMIITGFVVLGAILAAMGIKRAKLIKR